MALQWDARYAIGVPAIDAEHEEIFRQAGLLLTAMKAGKVQDELKVLIAFLEDYVVQHFAAEERLMETRGWPHLAAHRDEHLKFKAEFARLKNEFYQDGSSTRLVIEISTFVTTWLGRHIAGPDRAFGRGFFVRPIPG
jgi:hemerythrin